MSEMPSVATGDWIRVGARDAVVCKVYDPVSAEGGNLEIVYIDDRHRASNDHVKWTGTRWEFVEHGDYGGYADDIPRLSQWVRILRAGRRE